MAITGRALVVDFQAYGRRITCREQQGLYDCGSQMPGWLVSLHYPFVP